MTLQEERSETTVTAILRCARKQFARVGYSATTIDQIAADAGVAKGGVYHHFATKAAIFAAVFDQVSEDVAQEVFSIARAEKDVLQSIVVGTKAYFECCSKKNYRKILLEDGPSVLGWEKWRAIDAKHFGGATTSALKAAIDTKLIRPQPVEPLATLVNGAITEAAFACANSGNYRSTAMAYSQAFEHMLEGLRI